MRKVLSFVLVLSLVLGSFSMAFAAAPKDVVGEPSEEAVTVLSDLGVVSGYEDGTYKPENIVTRAEMAVLVIRALGLTDYVTAAKSSFKDMAGYGWAEGYIAYAQSLGFVSGYPDGTFKPGQTVSYDEAASMLVRALGYSPETLPGTWPANFVVKAKALGILDGIKSGAAGANRGDVAIMLYQTLDQRIGSANKDGDWVDNDATKDGSKPDTMLSRLGATPQPVKVLTNANTADASINMKAYLGAYAVTYVKDKKIIAVGDVESTFITGDYDADTQKLDTGDVEYNIATNVAIFPTTSALFNNGADVTGGVPANYFSTSHTGITVAADLSGKTVNEVYSVAVWAGTNHAAKSGTAKIIKDDQTLFGKEFVTDDDDEIDLSTFALLGIDSLDKIKENNIVTVYANGDNEITKVEVGTEVVKGKVTKKSGSKYTIDGKAYEIAVGGTAPNVGDTGTAYLAYNGKIFKWDAEDTAAGNYAVAVDDVRVVGSYTTNTAVKLFTKDGTEKLYDIKDSVVPAGNSMTGKIVKFDTNKSGELTTVYAVSTTASSMLSAKGTFDGKLVSDNVVVFVVNGSGDYSIGKLADIDKDTTMTLTYAVNATSDKIEAIIVDSTNTGASSTYGFVTKVADGLNADGDAAKLVTAVVNGKTIEYVANSNTDTYTAVKNKLVKFEFDGDEVKSATTVSAVAVASTYTTYQVGAYNGSLLATTVSGIDGNRIKMTSGYQVVDDEAVVLSVTFKANGDVDKIVASDLQAINDGYQAVLVQLDKDSDVYDLVIYIKAADIAQVNFLN